MEAAATAVTPPSLREQGNALFKEKNYLKTAAVYTQAIKADPENATVYRCVFWSNNNNKKPQTFPGSVFAENCGNVH